MFLKDMNSKMQSQNSEANKRLLNAQKKLQQNAQRLQGLQAIQDAKDKQIQLVLSREQGYC